jgi:hypothetical protein
MRNWWKRSRSASAPTGPPKWIDVKNDPLGPEVQLFLRSFNFAHKLWQQRCDRWETHVKVFTLIKQASPSTEKATRIDFLSHHLDILDSKFGILLNFNTLLLVAFNVVLNYLLNVHLVDQVFKWCGAMFGVFWLLTIATCLVGERRLVWGDLGTIDKDRYDGKDFEENPNLINVAGEQHIKSLIVAVVKRTNKFRVAVALTYANVTLMASAFIVAFWEISHQLTSASFGWDF